MKTLKELCLVVGGAEKFDTDRLRQIEQSLIEDHQTNLPWYLRAIVGIGAWLASCFFLGFAIVLIGWQEEHQTVIGCMGVILLLVAVAVGRQPWGIFAGQCALAVSLAAQAMIYYGFVNEHRHPLGTIAVFSIILATTLYIVFPNFLSRLMTCFIALQVTLFWIYAGSDGDPFSDGVRVQSDLSEVALCYWAFHLVAICWCFLRSHRSLLWTPLGYALIASLTAWQVENLSNIWIRSAQIIYSPAWIEWMFFHLRTGLTALTLFGILIWVAGGISVLRKNARMFIAVALALTVLVCLSSNGVILALLLMLLGFSLQNRPVLGLGFILFPVFLTHYYYNLNLDLLAKSLALMGSGAALLLLRSGLTRWVFADTKEGA